MKRILLSLGVKVLLIFVCMTAMAQQPTLKWAQLYNGMDSWLDEPAGIVVDEGGNSFVTGTSRGLGIEKIRTVKYAASGEELWAVQVESNATARAIAIDEAGGVYITGFRYGNETGADFIIIRYDAATGEQNWIQQYNGPASNFDFPIAIAADNAGGVYVTGYSYSSETGADYATVRYAAATGEETWAMRYNGPTNGLDDPKSIAVDNNGGVYVTGTSDGDYATVRYDAATGEESWVMRYNTSDTAMDAAAAVAVDGGGVYVTGSSNTDYATIRYDAATGEESWVMRYNGSDIGLDAATALAVGKDGGVYVTGSSNGDYATIRYDAATGEESWIMQYNGPGGGNDEARYILVSDDGGVIVSGSSPNYSSGTGIDFATVRYDAASGEEQWTMRYNSADNGNDEVRGITAGNGSVYATGFSNGNYVTIRYDAITGEQEWIQYFDGIGSMIDEAIAVAVDAAGNSYVTGTSRGVSSRRISTIKYAASGEELWAVQHESSSTARAIAFKNGAVFVTGSSNGDYVTVRYDAATGEEMWAMQYDGPANSADEAVAIALDDTGGVYITGSSYGSGTGPDYATVRYDVATGEEMWVMRYNGGNNGFDEARAIATDNNGSVYVTGYTDDGSGAGPDYATIRYDAATGEQIWLKNYDGPSNSNDQATAIAVDEAGGIYVTGSSNGSGTGLDYATIRYSPYTGDELWIMRYNGPDGNIDEATAIAVGNDGGVFVTGSSHSPTGPDFATIRYDAITGEEIWAMRYNGPANGFDIARAIVINPEEGVYVTGTSISITSDIATVRYDAATGEQTWAAIYDGHENRQDEGRAIAIDSTGGVIVTGYSNGSETGNDFITLKYSLRQEQCPELEQGVITGTLNAAVNTTGSVYTLSGTGATTFAFWSITGSEGNPYTGFTGQDSPTVSVDWPSEPDFYKISLTYGTPEGCTISTSPIYVHVFDPDAGLVTGSGWLNSPADGDYEFMQSSRKALFSLMARYSSRYENQILGSTMLLLHAGSFTFRSTSFEDGTLVIIDNRAYYRGRGSVTYWGGAEHPVEDERQFGFLVAAADGDFGESSAPDKFRLQIYVINEDGSQGAVVYDSQAGCPSARLDDNAEACTAIGGGNITIHKPSVNEVVDMLLFPARVVVEAQELEIYPTAVSDRATVSFSLEHPGDYALELYDMKGALVKRIAAGAAEAGIRYEQEIWVEGMGTGLYLARLTTSDKVQTVKMVVQR
ncbi:SBBP repeat-containing protein [Pontibacter pamirensis]|uniref:SBBP repeat-containing protein n=1 Tax=Pontibacter pamirensis TaxID=2562824 RepID=UPI0013898DAC|nr:SBBP repeat-containing protein [Pontibacter pamirensis]